MTAGALAEVWKEKSSQFVRPYMERSLTVNATAQRVFAVILHTAEIHYD